jgi:hypothetical protein
MNRGSNNNKNNNNVTWNGKRAFSRRNKNKKKILGGKFTSNVTTVICKFISFVSQHHLQVTPN